MLHCCAKLCDAGGIINAIISSHAQVTIFCIIPLRSNLNLDVNRNIAKMGKHDLLSILTSIKQIKGNGMTTLLINKENEVFRDTATQKV